MAEDILPPTQGFGAPAPEQRLGDMATDMPVVAQSRDYGMDYDNAPTRDLSMGIWEAAGRRETTIGAIMSREDAGLTYADDGTNPFEENKAFPQYANRPDRFVDVFNKQALARRRAQIDKETEMLAVQERHPILYTGAAMAVQFADPVNWLPLMTVAKIGKGAYALGRAGMGVGTVGAFGAVGASAAAATAAQEAILQSQQQLRTWDESATAIGGSFVLGGLLGVGGATLARAFSQPATRSALATVDAMIATNGSAGAAAVASPAMVDIVTRLKSAERVTTQEIEAATKTAMFEARQGRDLSDPDVLARVAFIDRLSTEVQLAARVSQVSELEGVVRNSFGSDGARLVDQGGVRIVQSVEDLPARADGVAHFDDTRGMFDGERAYIVADNVAGTDVRGVVLHEVGVHYGMERMIGAENFRVLLDDVMNRANNAEARFAEALAAVPAETPALHRGEEALAYLVENAPELGIVQRVIAAVKQFIRQVSGGSYAGLSEADIRQLAVASLRKWNPEARPAEIRYSRGPALRTGRNRTSIPSWLDVGDEVDFDLYVDPSPNEAMGLLRRSQKTAFGSIKAVRGDSGKLYVWRVDNVGHDDVRMYVDEELEFDTFNASTSGFPFKFVDEKNIEALQEALRERRPAGISGQAADVRYSRSQEKAKTAPEPIRAALESGKASVIADVGVFYSRAGEKREKAGIIVYHGSPHDFDRFSMDKIGTGEGAQAYGHGLYFAENEGVAKSYREFLSSRANDLTDPGNLAASTVAHYGGVEEGKQSLRGLMKQIDNFPAAYKHNPGAREQARKALELLESGAELPLQGGRMYEVRINADPEQFLDYDAPLSKQPQPVRDALGKVPWAEDYLKSDALTGGQIAPKTPEGVAQLREAGIPGIKYLDAGSRSAGDGSRNYVVFDDALVEIVRKYSRGGSRNERIATQLEALSKALDNIDNPDAFVAAMSSRGGSVGAEAVAEFSREDLQTYGKRANMVQDATWWLNPILRLRESPNPIAQKLGQMIHEDVIKSNMHMQGRTLGPAVETLVRQQLASILGRGAQQYEAIYQEGVKSGMRITRNQFSENISAAMRRGDVSEIPAVVKAAKMWRDVVFDPLKKMAQETRIANTDKYLLDPDIETKFAESYLHRMANHQKLTADEFGFKKTVADWMEGAMRDEYTKSSAATRARLAALDQDKVDLQLDPDARLLELEKLEKAYEDLDARFSREADIRRQDNELMAKAAELRRKGDRGGSKAALEAARAVRKSGGERYGEYLNAFKALNRRQRNVDFGFAGMAERQDEIVGKMGDIHDANLRGLERLVAKGQKLESDLARLDPQIRLEKIAELRDQIETVIEKTDKAAERLYNQVERAEKARARAGLKVLNEKRAGGIREALAGNVESKEAAAETARELALEESIRKYVKAEQGRSEKLSEIRRRIARVGIRQLDLDAQADELREAVNALIVQQSDMLIGRGDKVQRLKDKLARVDPAIVQKKLDQIDKDKQAITKKFYDRWEVQMGGEGVDINASVAQPRFSEWAKTYADQTFQHYSGRSKQAGTMPDFAIPLQKGPLQERTLPVPDTVLEPWLESDIGTIAAKYARSMLGQIEVTRKFGRPDMADQFKQFEDGYLRIREQINAAATPKEMMAVVEQQPSLRNAFEAWRRGDGEGKVTKERLFDWLKKREASDRTDIEAGLEMMLGKYANEENLSDFGSISRLLVQFNMLTKMGGYVIGSMTDVYRPAMVHGFKNYMQHGIKPLLSNLLRVPPAVRAELAQAGVGVEGWLRGYTTMNAGILDPYAPGSMAERMMEKMGRLGAKFSGMTWFNDFTRQVGGMESMTVILKAAMGKTNKDFLAVNGIDPGMAQRIADQFKVHGSDIKGVLVANSDKWSDVEAARVLRAAISKDVSTIFTEKSVGDVPHFANRPLGRVIFQFRGFAFASNQRVLMRGLQDDHQQLVGALVGMTTIGMMVAYLRSLRGGEDRYEKFMKSAENPGFWIGEGLDNSGIFSLLFEAANTTEKLSQAAGTSFNPIKQPLRMAFPGSSQQGESTRFVRRDPLSSVLGPSASIPQDIGKAIARAVDGDFRAAQKISPFLSTHPFFSDIIKIMSGDSAIY